MSLGSIVKKAASAFARSKSRRTPTKRTPTHTRSSPEAQVAKGVARAVKKRT